MPCMRYVAATANVPRPAAISTQGCEGWTSVVVCAPSRVWTRTSTSVMVACKPTKSMRLPPRPPGAVIIRRSTIESGSARVLGSTRSLAPSGKRRTTGNRMPASTGVRHTTS